MNIGDVVSTRFDVIRVSSTLLTTLTIPDRHKHNKWAYLEVYDRLTLVFRTSEFSFSEKRLLNVLYRLAWRLSIIGPTGSLALYVYRHKDSVTVETTVTLSSPMARRKTDLKVEKKRQTGSEIVKIISESESRAGSNVNPWPSRVQSRGSRPNPEVRNRAYTTVSQSLGLPPSISSGVKEIYRRTYSSINTPDFKRKSREGLLPVNPHTASIADVEAGSVHSIYGYTYKPTGAKSRDEVTSTRNTRITTATVVPTHLSVDQNLVIARLRSKIGVGISANAGEDAAQLGQTLRLLTGSINRWVGVIQLATGNPAGAKRVFGKGKLSAASVPRLISEMWLEVQYGWAPLIGSIDAYSTALFSDISKDPPIQTVRASASKRVNSRVPLLVNGSAGMGPYTGWTSTSVNTKLKIGLTYGMDSSLVNTASQLGLTGPTNLAWNLIPFSFVVDWWLPIGSALEACSAFDGLSFKNGYRTLFTKKKVSFSLYGKDTLSDATYDRYETKEEQVSGQGILLTRSALTGFPTASFPSIKNPLSFTHAANAASILTLLLTGRKSRL